MRFLLDTNVVSELCKPKPDPGVVRWLKEIGPLDFAILILSAEFDRAFNRHLIAIDPNHRLLLSPALRGHANSDYLASHFIEREGAALTFPERFSPVPEFLAEHRSQMSRKTVANASPHEQFFPCDVFLD